MLRELGGDIELKVASSTVCMEVSDLERDDYCFGVGVQNKTLCVFIPKYI